jgi:hypothetical protein
MKNQMMVYFFKLLICLNILFIHASAVIQVNGGNYGKNFKFIIKGTATEAIEKSSNVQIILLVGNEKEEVISKCSVENTGIDQIALYSCLYENSINEKVYVKKEQVFISEFNEDIEIKPLDLSIKYKEAKNLEFFDQTWKYYLEGEINGDNGISLGSISYMIIKVNDTQKLAGCSLSSKEENVVLLECKLNALEQHISDKILIPNIQSNPSTITFSPSLTQEIKIIIYKAIPFIDAKKLTFNENKWKFQIIVPYQLVPIATKSIVDILYSGLLSQSTCYSNDNSMLDCIVDKEEQDELGLVKIHYIYSDKSTLSWNNLTKSYEIPLEITLNYINSYNLVYTLTKLWSFKIKIVQILPENSLVYVDIKINDNPTITKCYYVNSELKCQTDKIEEENTSSLKISYQKKEGSIIWENFRSKDIPITISFSITYENSYNLNFKDGSWNFILKATTQSERIYKNFPFSIKIMHGPEKNLGIAYCYPIEDNTDLYNCETDYEEQSSNDLIIINGIKEAQEGSSIIWNTEFTEKKITFLASLHLVKAFDLMYLDEKWHFKIEIEEEELPNGSKLQVDILYDNTHKDIASCIYNDKILSCTRDSNIQSPSESLKILTEKTDGSINWEEIEISEISMPLTLNKDLKKAYGLFFDDNWHFYLDIENIGIIPSDSYFIIDILQNDESTTAKCELSNKSQSTTISTIYCHLDSNKAQSRKDDIRINVEISDGSIKWSNTITNLNNTIAEAISEPTLLNLIKAYDMEFSDNEWIFIITGKAERDLHKGEVFIIDINYILLEGEYQKKAKCWAYGGNKQQEIMFLCNVEYDEQTENGLIQIKYFQTDESTLIWNGGIDDNYQITLKGTSLTLVKAYGMTLEKTWKFRIEVQGKLIPPGAQITVDIIIGTTPKSIYCTFLNSLLIICDSGSSSNSELIKLSYPSITESSIEWIENRQPDYLIFLNLEFEFISVYNLYFDTTVNIWIFILKKRGIVPIGSKLSVDILYNGMPFISTCFYKQDNDELSCSVDKEGQDKMDLVQLNHIKTTESSITFINLFVDEKISLIADLTISKAENLRVDSNNYWIFDIYITDETIPNYSKFVIDIYYKINSIEKNAVAICYLDNKLLSCKTEFQSYELVTIKLTKTSNSLSTVTWKNIQEFTTNKIEMNITTSLNYINITKITVIQNKYYFFINLNNYIPQEGKVIVDIEIDHKIITCVCIAETLTKLKCEIKKEDYKNNTTIYVVPKNTQYSTVTWVNLEKNVRINLEYYNFIGAYDKKSINETYFGFKVLTSGGYLENGSEVYVRINYVDSYGNIISSSTVPCKVQQDFLFCEARKMSGASDFNLQLTSSSSSSSSSSSGYYDGIIWSNGNNENTPIYSNLNLDFEINSFDYNTESHCYEFSFKDTSYSSGSTFFVTDIIIGGITTYAYCIYKIDHFTCKTNIVDYNEDEEIYISTTKTYGSVDWNNLSEGKKISNLFFINIIKTYDLHFEGGKWKFKIKSDQEISSEKTFTLDILISGARGLANCQINEGVLECVVDSPGQNQNSLIKLNYNVDGEIKFLNLVDRDIPLDIELEFKEMSDLSYSYSTWKFKIKGKIREAGFSVPNYSKFTVDIKYDNTNDIAICSYYGIISDNIITLNCETNYKVSQTSLISLNTIKSEYSSITWLEEIPNNLEIFINAELYVDTVDSLIYDSNTEKWNFIMNLDSDYYSNYNYPLNSKFKIDLSYEQNPATATCIFISSTEYKLKCTPDVENQENTDTFEVSEERRDGTITFSNSKEKLTILYSANLNFIQAFDLILSSEKWYFKIKVSECNLDENHSILVDYKESSSNRKAICKMNNGLLYCESINYKYYDNYALYLIRNSNNKYAKWSNLYNNEPIYVIFHIKLKNSFGCFINGVWKFNIKYEFTEGYKNYINNHVLLDIMVNGLESTALCSISSNNILKCSSNHNNQNINDNVEILGNTEASLGTVYFSQQLTEEEKKFKPAELSINLLKIFDASLNNYRKMTFSIVGYLNDESNINDAATLTEIEIFSNKTNSIIRASCEITYDYYFYDIYYSYDETVLLRCNSDKIISNKDKILIKTDSEGNSKYIHFNFDHINNLLIYEYNENVYESDSTHTHTDTDKNTVNYHSDHDEDEDEDDTSYITPNNNKKTIITASVCGGIAASLIIVGILVWRILKGSNVALNAVNNLAQGNNMQNVINNPSVYQHQVIQNQQFNVNFNNNNNIVQNSSISNAYISASVRSNQVRKSKKHKTK